MHPVMAKTVIMKTAPRTTTTATISFTHVSPLVLVLDSGRVESLLA